MTLKNTNQLTKSNRVRTIDVCDFELQIHARFLTRLYREIIEQWVPEDLRFTARSQTILMYCTILANPPDLI